MGKNHLFAKDDTLRKFGLMMTAGFAALFCLFLLKRRVILWLLVFSAAFLIFGLRAPKFLSPIRDLWMKLGGVLGWVNSRLILLVIFYFVLTPIGLLMRIFGKDPLERRWLPQASSYWYKKEKKDSQLSNYERPF